MTTYSLPVHNGNAFHARFETPLRAAERLTTLQINIGYVCNLACRHCHVESSPARSAPEENMSEETARRVVDWARRHSSLRKVDITGGSPEMNPSFKWMVAEFKALGLHVMNRCNPTIIPHVDRATGESYEWIPAFLADFEVEVVASLPCYLEDNVERQRGKGAYDASVDGLRRLNEVGYGNDPRLRLNLVYNPVGAHLPPPQAGLQEDYRRELLERFDLVFNELWAITNMPIRRWRRELERDGKLEPYMALLIESYNPDTIDGLMCRHQVSVDPHGRLYDCDFNQALGMHVPGMQNRYLWDVSDDELVDRFIATADHCYGCTAGAGSSCGGEIA